MTVTVEKAPAAGEGRERRAGRTARTGRPHAVWALPGVLFFTFFAVVPMALALYLSFTSWDGLGDPRPVGLDNWKKLLDDPGLLSAKLGEEAAELGRAEGHAEVVHELADLLYFLTVKARASGVELREVTDELDQRERRLTRRPMTAKEGSL